MVSGITRTALYPRLAASIARPTPVFPDVGSITVPPGMRLPSASAASSMVSTMRSFTEPPGLVASYFPRMVALPPAMAERSISGVDPMIASIVCAYLMISSKGLCESPWAHPVGRRGPCDGRHTGNSHTGRSNPCAIKKGRSRVPSRLSVFDGCPEHGQRLRASATGTLHTGQEGQELLATTCATLQCHHWFTHMPPLLILSIAKGSYPLTHIATLRSGTSNVKCHGGN